MYVHYCHVPSLQTLYTYPDNFRACKVLIAAQYSGAEIKVVSEPPEFVLGQTNKTTQFLDNFPLGKVPAFITADGNGIYESNAIAYYGNFTKILSPFIYIYIPILKLFIDLIYRLTRITEI